MADQRTGSAERRSAGERRPRSRAELQARREARRRERRRRRSRALAIFVAAGVAIPGAIVLLSGSGGSDPSSDHGPSRAAATNATSTKVPTGERAAMEIDTPARNSKPQPDWEPHTGPVPILEWHVLGEPPPESPYPELYVSRSDFAEQIEWLAENEYEAVTLEQVEAAWWDGGRLPPKPVILSFDDGYRPDFTFAMPLLHEHGWAGVLNLKAEGSGLYRSNVETMIGAGWELASHTVDHLDLTSLDEEGLKHELEDSRRILREEYGVPVRNFCYPAGRFDEAVIEAVRGAGYVGAMTQEREDADSEAAYELGRYSILRSSGVGSVADALEG